MVSALHSRSSALGLSHGQGYCIVVLALYPTGTGKFNSGKRGEKEDRKKIPMMVIGARAYPGFCSMKGLDVLLLTDTVLKAQTRKLTPHSRDPNDS